MEVIPEQDRPQLFDLLFKSIDYFRSEVSKIENGEPLSNNIDNFLNTINTFIDKINGEAAEAQAQAQPAQAAPAAQTSQAEFVACVFG